MLSPQIREFFMAALSIVFPLRFESPAMSGRRHSCCGYSSESQTRPNSGANAFSFYCRRRRAHAAASKPEAQRPMDSDRTIKRPCHASPAARQRALIRFEDGHRQSAGEASIRRISRKLCRQNCRQNLTCNLPVRQQSGCRSLPTEKAVLPTENVSEPAAIRRTIFKKANKASIFKNQIRSHNLKVAGSNPAPATNFIHPPPVTGIRSPEHGIVRLSVESRYAKQLLQNCWITISIRNSVNP
jgi:hypothetical protein